VIGGLGLRPAAAVTILEDFEAYPGELEKE